MRRIKDNKGLLGLDTVKGVIIALLILAVMFIVVFLSVTNLRDAFESLETKQTTYVGNDSLGTVVSNFTYEFDYNPSTVRNIACTITKITLANGSTIPASNYSVSGCTAAYTGGEGTAFNNTEWKAVYSYTSNNPGPYQIGENLTQAGRKFMQEIPTFFVLLGVIVLILLISIVIVAVTRFSGGETGLPRSHTTEMSD